MNNSYQPTTDIGSHEDFYRMMLLKYKKEKIKEKKQWEKEVDKEIEEKNLKLERMGLNRKKRGLFFRNKIDSLNNFLRDDNIKRPKVNLASQVKPEKKYRYDGATMTADEVWSMPDIVDRYIGEEFRRRRKQAVDYTRKATEKAIEAKRARKGYQAVKTTAEAAKAAKGIKSIGLFIKSFFTVASLESFGIGLLVTLVFILVQAFLYYACDIKSMKLEWYDWVLLVAAIALLILIIALVVIICAEYVEIIEIGIWVAERVSS